MSYLNSRLNDFDLPYDMVMSVTQPTLNSDIQKWLLQYRGDGFKRVFVNDVSQGGGVSPKEEDLESLIDELGFDPFTLKTSDTKFEEKVESLAEKKFLFGFHAIPGIPRQRPAELPPAFYALEKTAGYGANVSVNYLFYDFQLISLATNPTSPGDVWLNQSQNSANDERWVLTASQSMAIRQKTIDSEIDAISPATKRVVKQYGEEHFSVRMPYFDLLSKPQHVQFSSISAAVKERITEEIGECLLDAVRKCYGHQLTEQGLDQAGVAVVADILLPGSPPHIPTQMGLTVSIPKSSSGETHSNDLYAEAPPMLNYLAMTQKRDFGDYEDFAWNWLEPHEYHLFAGSFSLNAYRFVDMLNHALSAELKDAVLNPVVDIESRCEHAHMEVAFQSASGSYQFDFIPLEENHESGNAGPEYGCLSFDLNDSDYFDEDSDDAHCGHHREDSLKVWYGFDSAVILYQQSSEVFIGEGPHTQVHIKLDGHRKSGKMVDFALEKYYQLTTKEGQLAAILKNKSESDQSESFQHSEWGDEQEQVDMLQAQMKKDLRGRTIGIDQQITRQLQSVSNWMLPGSLNYTFEDTAFGEKYDVVAHLSHIAKLK